MSVRLQFRQGAFQRELECESVEHALTRAGAFVLVARCTEFRVANELGVELLSDCEVRAAYARLRNASNHPTAKTGTARH